ncbi:TetR/AcrR family transcriptional regulator [Nocardioides silvaticus]|uniref:TetR/AcrR family transcriptional regulator n=1 Tax=Nocardioides silvaticus TaxID=2201891 RepID=UPI0011B250C3|nr:TetR family transcriptional regulator [Nocardioides silvaticus]
MGEERSDTKVALIRAAEEVFAQYGIDGARAGDILRLADQANESAINYHFGSRWGLVRAIIERHLAEMEVERVVRPGGLRDLVADLLAPAIARLTTQEGRFFLRIVNQVLDRAAPLPVGEVPRQIAGTKLLDQVIAVHAALTHLPADRRADRLQHFVVFQSAALAARARRIDAGEAALLSHEAFAAELVDVLTAALAAESKSPEDP